MSKLDEIKKALQAATPGPWVADDENGIIWSTDAKVVFNFTADEEEGDVNLIANAPEWLRFLLDELERLEQEREKLIEGLRYLMKELGKLRVKPENATAFHAYKKMRNILKEIGVTVE